MRRRRWGTPQYWASMVRHASEYLSARIAPARGHLMVPPPCVRRSRNNSGGVDDPAEALQDGMEIFSFI